MDDTDVRSGHLHSSGFIVKARARVKAFDVVGDGVGAGLLEIWDTAVAPTAATYGRSADTVTVTKSAHGLKTGDTVGISFEEASGVIATPGSYSITVTGTDTFTLTDINSGTIATSTVCRYVSGTQRGYTAQWLSTYHTSSSDVFFNGFSIPGNGILANIGIYVYAVNLDSINIYYG
jgi:hypothetical protein